MPGPKPSAINLNDVERQELELLVRRYTTGQQKVIRARIVLLAAMGKNNREIANELEVSLDTARLWRQSRSNGHIEGEHLLPKIWLI